MRARPLKIHGAAFARQPRRRFRLRAFDTLLACPGRPGRLGRRRPLAWLLLVIALAGPLPALAAPDGALAPAGMKIRVRGSGKIEARAARSEGQLILSGVLVDDAQQALAGETVTVLLNRDSDARDPTTAEALRAARGCDRTADAPPPGAEGRARAPRGPLSYAVRVAGPTEAPEIVLVTDEDGRFCFRSRLEPDRYSAHLAWRGSSLVERADTRLAFDTSRQALMLRFDPTPHVLSLDAAQAAIDVVAIVDEDGTARVAPGLGLKLAGEGARTLGELVTDGAGRAHFRIDTPNLGPPGQGDLEVSFPGNADIAFATQAVEVTRHAKVVVRVPAAERGELKPAVPEDGVPLLVEVKSVAGSVSEGAVEASVGDVVVGAAPVERGLARLTLRFAAQGEEVFVRLRYVPASPWYEGLGEPAVRVPIRPPSLWSKAPILLAGLAVLAFFLLGRATSLRKPTAARAAPRETEGPEGKAGIEVAPHAERGQSGWRGRVVDAHERSGVAGARVWIERGSFDGREIVGEATCDPRGDFTLHATSRLVGGEQLTAEGRLHARLAQALPPEGHLAIALVLRRRALLGRLVAWARRTGAPFDAKPEATPGHVRRAAAGRSADRHHAAAPSGGGAATPDADFRTARWADAVERAVFGEGVVDARVESEIEGLAPGGEGGGGGHPPAEPAPDPPAKATVRDGSREDRR